MLVEKISKQNVAGKRHPYFGQVTWPTFPPGEVNLSETVVLPECVCLILSGKEAKTTDAWGFPPAPQTLTSLSPKSKHKPKCPDQNKQAARAEKNFAAVMPHKALTFATQKKPPKKKHLIKHFLFKQTRNVWAGVVNVTQISY